MLCYSSLVSSSLNPHTLYSMSMLRGEPSKEPQAFYLGRRWTLMNSLRQKQHITLPFAIHSPYDMIFCIKLSYNILSKEKKNPERSAKNLQINRKFLQLWDNYAGKVLIRCKLVHLLVPITDRLCNWYSGEADIIFITTSPKSLSSVSCIVQSWQYRHSSSAECKSVIRQCKILR